MITFRKHMLLLNYFGLRWILFRVFYEIKKRSGFLKWRTPVSTWEEKQSDATPYIIDDNHQLPHVSFDMTPHDLMTMDGDNHDVILEAENILNGQYTFFSKKKVSLGFPPNWHQHFSLLHWSDIDDFSSGDIKLAWELGRFTFAYTLVRAYWRTKDERYSSAFWQLFEDWWQHNPPNLGVHWKCGQEISFRIMACCFALFGFAQSSETTSDRRVKMALFMAASAERIAANIDYALQQQNNHGISEAIGLWTVGVVFPELYRSPQWAKKGHALFVKQAHTLIYDDGGFSQHSMNYHRLMLQNYLWVFSLAKRLKYPLHHSLSAQILKAYHFLYQLHDIESGYVPNYGANDGALILPLNRCDYRNYRPVLQALHYYFYGERCFERGPWDEDLLWLFGSSTLKTPIKPMPLANIQAKKSGYFTLRSNQSWVLTRCAQFRHRPSHADQLHVDLWWQGVNIAIDAGSFSYNAAPPWHHGFSETCYHNTVTVDAVSQMEKWSRFIWLPWSKGEMKQYKTNHFFQYWEGAHQGYQRLKYPAAHRRGILQLGEEHWLILDYLDSTCFHDYKLHYLLCDAPYQWQPNSTRLTLHIQNKQYHVQAGSNVALHSELLRSETDSAFGWQSCYYNEKTPALSMQISTYAKQALLWTALGPDIIDVTLSENTLLLKTAQWSATIDLDFSSTSLLKNVTVLNHYLAIE